MGNCIHTRDVRCVIKKKVDKKSISNKIKNFFDFIIPIKNEKVIIYQNKIIFFIF